MLSPFTAAQLPAMSAGMFVVVVFILACPQSLLLRGAHPTVSVAAQIIANWVCVGLFIVFIRSSPFESAVGLCVVVMLLFFNSAWLIALFLLLDHA
jgi:hypothetical protein